MKTVRDLIETVLSEFNIPVHHRTWLIHYNKSLKIFWLSCIHIIRSKMQACYKISRVRQIASDQYLECNARKSQPTESSGVNQLVITKKTVILFLTVGVYLVTLKVRKWRRN